MLYLSGIFRSEAGTPNAKEISRRLSILSESIKGGTHRGDTACAPQPLSPISPRTSHSIDPGYQNTADGADDPSVAPEERVKLEETTDWAYEETEEAKM